MDPIAWVAILGLVGFILLIAFSRFVTNCLMVIVAGGALFAIGYFIARLFDGPQTTSLIIGLVVPAACGLGRLLWLALGLPTPWSDYNRWRDQDHRNYWS